MSYIHGEWSEGIGLARRSRLLKEFLLFFNVSRQSRDYVINDHYGTFNGEAIELSAQRP